MLNLLIEVRIIQEWEVSQRELLTDAIVGGQLTGNDETLYVKEPRPSIWDAVGQDHIRGQKEADNRGWVANDGPMGKPRQRFDPDRVIDISATAPTPDVAAEDTLSNVSVMRVLSVIFAME